MKEYDHEEVTRLLDEMEGCVNRVKVLVANFIGYGEGDEHPDL